MVEINHKLTGFDKMTWIREPLGCSVFVRWQKLARALTVGFVLTYAASMAQAQRSIRAVSQCYTATSSHVESRDCLENEAHATERRMIQAESGLLAAVEQLSETLEQRQRIAAALNEASVAYPRARDAECELQATLAAGGNAASDRRLLCRIELDDRRIADLLAATATTAR